jgi:hypothetical protein
MVLTSSPETVVIKKCGVRLSGVTTPACVMLPHPKRVLLK